ncbi:hypothetical protein C1H46_028198 [Malus baccata]|uniref:Beta-glucosidase n=1 Tax=Malus baccata TaxID=106549 RepID=A0A540LIG2_MALBA|nr:hypothetical protein C1H46_028198 [Malus baccata]
MAKKVLLKEYDEEIHEVCRSDFPPNFVFGVATSAYQEDVELIAKLGFEAHRFSIAWSRIFPGIQPYVTLYHWDLPLYLHENMGGWLNKQIVYGNLGNGKVRKWKTGITPARALGITEYFSVYADTCFASFGDRVKDWITFNEPLQTAINGYGVGTFAPGRHSSTEPYLVAHHQLLAHAAAVSIYRSKYKTAINGYGVGTFAPGRHSSTEPYLVAHHQLLAHAAAVSIYRSKYKAASEWLYVVPWGMHKVLNYIAQRYNNPPIYVTENGMDDEDNDTSPLHEMLDDKLRVSYFKRYLSAVAKAIR